MFGQQLAVDATIVAPLHRNGQAKCGCDTRNGVSLARARRCKEKRYPELIDGPFCHLVVFSVETGGRWSSESAFFIHQLAEAKARSAPVLLRKSASRAYQARWTAMLSVAAQNALAASILEEPLLGHEGRDGDVPALGEVLADSRFDC